MTNLELEREFFAELSKETKIEIVVRQCAYLVVGVHEEIERLIALKQVPQTPEASVSRHFRKNCGKVKTLVTKLKELKEEAVRLGPNELPRFLFSKFGTAFDWMCKDIRRYFGPVETGGLECVCRLQDAFHDFKDQCRPSTQCDEVIDGPTFASVMKERFAQVEKCCREVANAIEVVEERRAMEADQEYQRVASGKGRSLFGRTDVEYREVKLLDATHLRLFGEVFEITSRACWRILDNWLEAHFADEPFRVTQVELEKFTTPDGRRLRTYIHRQTLEEVGHPRRGNSHYTGYGEFRRPTPENVETV